MTIALGALFLGVVALFGFAIWDACVTWPAYRTEHHCEPTGRYRSDTHVQCHLVGESTVCLPVTTTSDEWKCDGGERVWR